MHIIDCKAIRDSVLREVYPKRFIGKNLLAIMKEENAANHSYIKSIKKLAGAYGLPVEVRIPDPTCVLEDIRSLLFARQMGTCVLLVGFDEQDAKRIPPLCGKAMFGKRFLDNLSFPDVVRAVLCILENADLLDNPPRRTAIIGRSRNARSLHSSLVKRGHTVTVVHTRTADKDSILREADLIVSFAGSPNLIKSDMVKDGAVIISVGCGTLDGKLCGDIDMDSLADRDVTVTPTPGGVGPICTAVLFRDIARWEVKYCDN